MRILVVEDEAALREGIVDLLEGDDYMVTAVGDGVADVETGLRELFDLVVLDPDKAREYARRMSEDAARLGRVVTNMLGFSQLERGGLSVDAQVGPFGETLRELAEQARPALDRAGASLETEVAPDLRARFDRDALARIVGNLLDNAEKYTRGARDRTIRLAALRRGDAVEVSIEDRGPGVADRTTLFRAFARGVSDGDGPAGLGLGLALSMSLARAMDGDLSYTPRDGGGATFVLRLPPA